MNHLPSDLPTAATYAGLANEMSVHSKLARPYLFEFNLILPELRWSVCFCTKMGGRPT